MNDTMPAYLSGSLQGNDWTSISVDVTPYPDIMYNIKKKSLDCVSVVFQLNAIRSRQTRTSRSSDNIKFNMLLERNW